MQAIARRDREPRRSAAWRAPARGHRAGGRGARGRRPAAHPHLHRDQRHPPRAQAADDPRAGARPEVDARAAGARASSTTSSSRPRTRPAPTVTSWSRSSARRSPRAPRPSTSRTPSATRRPTSTRRFLTPALRARARRCGDVTSQRALPQRPRAGRRQQPGRPCGPARARSSARVNGIGERAGNTCLEEVVMALQTRRDVVDGLETGIDTTEIYPHQPPASSTHRRRGPAEQGRSSATTPSPTRPASTRTACSRQPAHLRDHDARVDRAGRRASWCSASTPAATPCATRSRSSGYELDRRGAQRGVRALQGARRPREQLTAPTSRPW